VLFDRARSRITGYVDDIAEELRAPFSYAAQQYPDGGSCALLLTGGGARIAGVARRLGAALETPTRTVTPADLAECPPPLLGKCGEAGLTMAVGLAQFARDRATVGAGSTT
jgi:Tfp pilus assembly PilM family ATPase